MIRWLVLLFGLVVFVVGLFLVSTDQVFFGALALVLGFMSVALSVSDFR